MGAGCFLMYHWFKDDILDLWKVADLHQGCIANLYLVKKNRNSTQTL
jgi:hypothetical protein